MTFIEIVQWINNNVLWGYPMIIALVGAGILFTLLLGFPQVTKLGAAFKHTFGGMFSKEAKEEGSMSSFQSLATAIAAQVGTGNIAGVATAIISGGPGAIFWMWLAAFFGMGTIYVEAALAQKYRETRNGQLVGGPAYYLKNGFAEKGHAALGHGLATFFAIAIIIALGFVGNMVQSNSIASAVTTAFDISPFAIGILLAILAAFVFLGGMKRIASFAELVVPIMALIYILGSIAVLVKFSSQIIPTFQGIFTAAFTGKAVMGGAQGIAVRMAIRYGVARGLFSNEAGMGSTPNSHAVANVNHPIEQSLAAMVGVFIDTVVVCSATALSILVTGAHLKGLKGVAVTQEAFNLAFGSLGVKFLAICLTFFAFTTIVGWYYFGENNVKYLSNNDGAIRIYQIILLAFIVMGSLFKVDLVWELADMFNGIMVIPNLIGLFFLFGEVRKLRNEYRGERLSGKQIKYVYPYQ